MIQIIVQTLLFVSLVLSIYMVVVTLERCRSEKRYTFVYCIFTLFLYNLGYFIEISSVNIGSAVIGVKIMYAGGTFATPLFFFFVADYCEIRIPKKFYRIPLLLIPVFHYAIVLTFDYHKLLYTDFWFDLSKTLPDLDHDTGPLYPIGQLYPFFCVALSCLVLIPSIARQSRGRRLGLVLLLISALAPLSAHLVYLLFRFLFGTSMHFIAFLMILSVFIFYYNIVRNDMFDLAPKAHAITLDLIRDAFVVLDWGKSYTGSNKKAQELFPALSELHKGSSILGLKNWPGELTEETDRMDKGQDQQREIEFTLRHKPGRFYSGWTNRVLSESGITLGWVILIQDVTEMVSLIQDIQTQRDEIAAMRDNLKEGIFLMDREYRIQDSYSRAMEDVMCSRDLRGRRFTDLLSASYNQKDLAIVADYFKMIIEKSASPEMLENMNPLEEFSYTSEDTGEQKTLRCLFVPLEKGKGETFIMGTIQDISAETVLKKQLASEEARRQDEMRNLFEVMNVEKDIFDSFIKDTDNEFSRIEGVLQNKKIPNKQKLINLYQSVHAVKSNSLIVGLAGFGEKLHALEDGIKALRDRGNEPEQKELLGIAEELKNIMSDREKLTEIVARLQDFSASGSPRKEGDIFADSLKQVCKRVANDENKKVNFVIEAFDQEALKSGKGQVMKDILTQLLRNAVYHGIESPEQRRLAGKDDAGKISLSVRIRDGILHMRLWDDGRGLDYDSIAQKAEKQGLLKDISPGNIDRQFLSNIIFSPGFSTSEKGGMHAGRGIGLNLVKDRLREVGGKIGIQNKNGKGLSFDIKIPLA